MIDRLRFRVWDKRLNRYLGKDDPTPMLMSNGNLAYLDDEGMKFYKVEQCTGLNDKNGKRIYEGDLIKIDDDVAVIKWSDYYARFMLESSEDNFDFETTYAEECKVIGNIHENADLLEVGGK